MGWVAIVAALGLLSCDGELALDVSGEGSGDYGEGAPGSKDPADKVEINTGIEGVGVNGIRRLSRFEYDETLLAMLEDDTRPGQALPEDVADPFDNDWSTQLVSGPLITTVETLATEAAARLVADPARRDRVVGCTPTAADDADCFRSFLQSFGRRAYRRALTDEEVAAYMALQAFAVEADDFYVGVELALMAFLQSPEFLYVVEKGIPVEGRDGYFRLNQWEVASRLSYFLWATMPDDILLDAAEAGELGTPEQVQAQAERMMQDGRYQARVHRFFSQWLAYSKLSAADPLGAAMWDETNALIDRVAAGGDQPWQSLFTYDQTYVTTELADHYGLPAPATSPGWIDYGDSGRGGLFSHATFLSVAARFGDTSPTQRGKFIRERLLCQPINPPPPDSGVDVDSPPMGDGTSSCKEERYKAISAQSVSCANCHGLMDPVGLGLERYDEFGRYREVDDDDGSCDISGEGELLGVGAFNGPAELGQVLVQSGELERCMVTQVYRAGLAHREGPDDRPHRDAVAEQLSTHQQIDQMIIDLVGHEAFGYRILAPTEVQQ